MSCTHFLVFTAVVTATQSASLVGYWQSKTRNLCAQLDLDPKNSNKYIATTLSNLEAEYVADIHLDLSKKTARYYSIDLSSVSYNLSVNSLGTIFSRGDKFDFDEFHKVSACFLAPALTTKAVIENIEEEEEKKKKVFTTATDLTGTWKSTRTSVCLKFNLKNKKKGKYNVIPSTHLAGIAFQWVKFKYLRYNSSTGFWEGRLRAKLVLGCKLTAIVVVTSDTTMNITHSQSLGPSRMVKLSDSQVAEHCQFAAKFTIDASESGTKTFWLDELHRRCSGGCIFSLMVVMFVLFCTVIGITGYFVRSTVPIELEEVKDEIKLAEVF